MLELALPHFVEFFKQKRGNGSGTSLEARGDWDVTQIQTVFGSAVAAVNVGTVYMQIYSKCFILMMRF